ncbi:MAG: hypothetical protein CL693_11875 [Cellvibrionaceae bacterium]|nr:hypothetical protein [Cellvibrionaceae bacterium]|tara:strand:- start:202 stop:615 length:414 start_codon:yes stop_codon:yes gene_type:complete
MTLKKLLLLQLTYCLLGISYNIVSYNFLQSTGQALTTTPPVIGFFAMMIYGLFLIPALLERVFIYKCLMCIAIIVYGYGGIVVHALNYAKEPTLYFSVSSLIAGIGINIIGLALNFYAVLCIKHGSSPFTETKNSLS